MDKHILVANAAIRLLETLQLSGEWDDGCFYYNKISASELEAPMRELGNAIAKAQKETP